MTQSVTTTESVDARIFEVLTAGNIGILKPEEKVAFYKATCESLGVNPLTRPFEYLTLNGKVVLYATRACADQLRKLHGISIGEPRIEYMDDICVVTVTATDAQGRTDSDIGAVPIGNLKGEARSNALMKAITKSKRRVTLSMAGLGWLDETEIDSIPASRRPPVAMPQPRVTTVSVERPPVDEETGEVLEADNHLFWSDAELRDGLASAALGMNDLRAVLGVEKVTKENYREAIAQWLEAGEGRTLAELIDRAAGMLAAT